MPLNLRDPMLFLWVIGSINFCEQKQLSSKAIKLVVSSCIKSGGASQTAHRSVKNEGRANIECTKFQERTHLGYLYPCIKPFKSLNHFGFYQKNALALSTTSWATLKYTDSTCGPIQRLTEGNNAHACPSSPATSCSTTNKKGINMFFHAPLTNNSVQSKSITEATALCPFERIIELTVFHFL